MRLEAEYRLPSFTTQISDRKLRTRLTNCAAGRACNPSLLVMRTSRCAKVGAFLCPSLMPGSSPSAGAETFRSEIWVVKAGKRYSASSLIDILRANLDCGATATLEAHGVDADDALDELEKLLAEFHEKETD